MAGGRGIYATAKVLSMRKKIRGAKLPYFHTSEKLYINELCEWEPTNWLLKWVFKADFNTGPGTQMAKNDFFCRQYSRQPALHII